MAADCPSVPEGYSPLANVPIDALDENGNVLVAAVASTDDCGLVSVNLPAGADKIRASAAGFRDLIAGVDSLAANGGVASTIPEGADYRVGFLTSYANDTLGFSITDTLTNKAVVGLPAEAFSVELDAVAATFDSVGTSLTSEAASIVLVTDASGSMSDPAFTDPATNISYSRNNIAATAAHQFLDQKAVSDEVAMLIFNGGVDLINQDFIDLNMDIVDANGADVPYTLSESGFTTDASALRLIVDAYNEDTKLWDPLNKFDNHPDTPALEITNRYLWGGPTAMYDATIRASNEVVARNNPRKFVIAMTDGSDTASQSSLQDAINQANLNSTPVYTIGFEFTREDDLTRLAEETGATYFQANSLQVSDAYSTIQTNILFQYVGVLSQPLGTASAITLNLDLDGDGVVDATRVLTR